MTVAVEMALEGFARLHALGHPANRSAAVELIESMFRLRGLQRLWALYPRQAPTTPQPSTVAYAEYFPQ
jgi:hypothetical protein